jgi:hypothetical protein
MSSSKIQRYGVDYYNLKINNGGLIELDAGTTGEVRIDGDLTVLGNTTTIESTDLAVADNIIIVNSGEGGAGVTLGSAGLLVDRGSLANVGFYFDESKPFTNPATALVTNGAFIFSQADGNGNPTNNSIGIYTNTINTTNGNDLYFLSNSDFSSKFGPAGPRLAVTGTTDYQERIFPYTGSPGNRTIAVDASQPDRIRRGLISGSNSYNDDLIPNIKVVTDYVKAHYERNFQDRLISPGPDGFVTPGNFASGFSIIELSSTDAGSAVSKIDFKVNSLTSPVATYFDSEIRLFDVKINDNIISTIEIDGDLVLSGNGNGVVKFASPLTLSKVADPVQPTNGTTIYAKDEADGGTGIFFVNDVGTQDELISRNKALLYSIIF